MGLPEILLIALGLAMDCLAVAVASGISCPGMGPRLAFRMALFFGGFQSLMAVIGWSAGVAILPIISSFDHWIAFALLAAVGGKMIYESRGEEDERRSYDPARFAVLIALSVATSIDSLAVGISFSLIGEPIALPAGVIGAFSFSLTLAGVAIGRRFGHIFERKLEVVGGLILIGIGIKILAQHLS